MERHDQVRAPLELDVTREGCTAVVAPTGEVDLLNARTLYAKVLEQSGDGLTELVLDFTGISFIDSTGLAALVKAARRLGAAGVTVRIVNASPHTTRVLTMTGVDRTIQLG